MDPVQFGLTTHGSPAGHQIKPSHPATTLPCDVLVAGCGGQPSGPAGATVCYAAPGAATPSESSAATRAAPGTFDRRWTGKAATVTVPPAGEVGPERGSTPCSGTPGSPGESVGATAAQDTGCHETWPPRLLAPSRRGERRPVADNAPAASTVPLAPADSPCTQDC